MNKELEPINPNLVIDKDIVDMITSFYEQLISRKNNSDLLRIYNNLRQLAINKLVNVAVLCDSEDDAKQIARIANYLHLHWKSGESYIRDNRFNGCNKYCKDFCYLLYTGTYTYVSSFPEDSNIIIKSTQWFINNYKVILKAMNVNLYK